ncbi:MAG: hypothetical protein K6F47_00875 [Bacteroidaceae bacterium]|nr:hypothetical protein [Bacteroidaceae bacterium]
MAEIKQPTPDIQELLSDLMAQEPEKVTLCGKEYRIGWLHNANTRKFSHIMVKEKNPLKRNVKVCACVLLNHRWGLFTWFLLNFWYGIYWRWLYYVRDIDQIEIAAVLNCAKKKIQSEPLALNIILSTGMMDTMMMMAGHELGQAAHAGGQRTP